MNIFAKRKPILSQWTCECWCCNFIDEAALNVGDHEVNIEFLSEWAVSQEFHHPGTPKACLKQWGEPPAE
ncbi:MAG: hypothetical protein AB7Q45_26900, partial [Planctomycetaceae bacterium]